MRKRILVSLRLVFTLPLLVGGLASCGGSSSSRTATRGSGTNTPLATLGVGSDAEHPVPFGETGKFNGWDVTMLPMGGRATDTLDRPPPSGIMFVTVNYEGTRTGAEPASAGSLRASLLGASGVERLAGTAESPFICKATFKIEVVRQGETIKNQMCFGVPTSDLPTLVAKIGGFRGTGRWFTLR